MALSIIAVTISAIALALRFWDRRARLRVRIEEETVYEYEEAVGAYPAGRLVWIDIVNLSSRRMKVASVWLEWTKWRWLPLGINRGTLPELQRVDEGEQRYEYRFWVEPWGDSVLSLDADELEY